MEVAGCDEMSKFLQSCMGQMETAANFQLTELKGMPDAIREDRQSIPASKPVRVPIVSVAPPPPTMTVFMLKSARYTDHDGRKLFVGQFEDAIMPVATAQKAMRLALAVPTNDPRRATLRGTRGGDFRADALDVVDIDSAEKYGSVPYVGADKSDVIAAANFTVIDRACLSAKVRSRCIGFRRKGVRGMSKGPPGWKPHVITTPIDGWVIDPHDEDRIPPAIAEMMARAMPQPIEVEIIRARMIQRMVDRGLSYE